MKPKSLLTKIIEFTQSVFGCLPKAIKPLIKKKTAKKK
jgi:hypothetical protein